MNFLALHPALLFPIITIAALVLAPLNTIGLAFRCAKGFFKEGVAHLSPMERIRAFACAFILCSHLQAKSRLMDIGYLVTFVGSWAFVLTLTAALLIPAWIVGSTLGALGVLVVGFKDIALDAYELTTRVISKCALEAMAPAGRSLDKAHKPAQ